MRLTKSELKEMIKGILREELLREAPEQPKEINEDGYMSSLNYAVGSQLDDITLCKGKDGKYIKTLPSNELEYKRGIIANDTGRNRKYEYLLAKGLPSGTTLDTLLRGFGGDSDLAKGFKYIQSRYEADNRMDVEHNLEVRSDKLYYSVILKPRYGYRLSGPRTNY